MKALKLLMLIVVVTVFSVNSAYSEVNDRSLNPIGHSNNTIDLSILSRVDVTLEQIDSIEQSLRKKGKLKSSKIDGIKVTDRIKALRGALYTLRNGFKKDGKIGFRPSYNNLSKEQKELITSIFSDSKKIRKINNIGKSGRFKNIKSMQEFKDIVVNKLKI